MDIVKDQGGQFKWEIDRMHRESAFSTISHDMHRLRRSAISSYFSKSSIADLEPFIHKRVELLCDTLRSQSRRAPVDVHALFLAYANDTVCAYSFDYSMNLLDDPEVASNWKMTINAIASLTPLIKQFPWLIPVVRRIPGWLLRSALPKLERLLSLQARMNLEATKAIQNHQDATDPKKSESSQVQTTEQNPRFLQQILESNLAASEKTAERMGQEAFSIIAAGGETVARTLTTLTYYLITNPPILAKLRRELQSAQPDPSTPLPFQELEQLPWLTAVIKESMRLWGVMASRSPLVSPTPLHLAQTELYLAVAAVFRRFDLELYDTERLRDVESTRDCFTGEASKGSQGVRVRVVGEPGQ
ncbi:MAG: hypothetical protein Q9208_006664 [Pyrenodesmia sp. 3 TL-2023]